MQQYEDPDQLRVNGDVLSNEFKFEHNTLMPREDAAPSDANAPLDEQVIGVDANDLLVKANDPKLVVLLFPHLFIHAKGHYSLVSKYQAK